MERPGRRGRPLGRPKRKRWDGVMTDFTACGQQLRRQRTEEVGEHLLVGPNPYVGRGSKLNILNETNHFHRL